jgi:hypothetical protein
VTDPNNSVPLRTGGDVTPAIAVDHRNGTLYTVWQDARFSGFAHDSIALSVSKDGGLTWSAPIQVNKTPTNISRAKQQAFTPSVAVAANGNVAITYFDLRNPDNQSSGLPTDYWIVFGRSNQDLTKANNWGGEQRLTNSSFNMELAPVARGYFVGDYMALSAGGENQNSFSAFFSQTVSSSDPASIFFRDPSPDDSDQTVSQRVDQQIAGAVSGSGALAALIVHGVKLQSTDAPGQISLTDRSPGLLASPDVVPLDQFFVRFSSESGAHERTESLQRAFAGSRFAALASRSPQLFLDWLLPSFDAIE